MTRHRPRVALLAASLPLTGCGSGATASPGPEPSATAPATPSGPAPSAAAETVPRFHVGHGGPTHGRVSVAGNHVKELLRTLDPALHPVVVMGDHASLARRERGVVACAHTYWSPRTTRCRPS
ncbi:hypothetical protein [Streptomyces sp. NPDC001381]|uniref:hypothetical protein n=1 Tax=Streptomyces sp. NPDC001381 TaxID=3364567 RepID=UPI00368730F8